jgi:hypothetical protein
MMAIYRIWGIFRDGFDSLFTDFLAWRASPVGVSAGTALRSAHGPVGHDPKPPDDVTHVPVFRH